MRGTLYALRSTKLYWEKDKKRARERARLSNHLVGPVSATNGFTRDQVVGQDEGLWEQSCPTVGGLGKRKAASEKGVSILGSGWVWGSRRREWGMRADCFLSLLMGDWGCAGAIAAGLWIGKDLVFREGMDVVGGGDLDALGSTTLLVAQNLAAVRISSLTTQRRKKYKHLSKQNRSLLPSVLVIITNHLLNISFLSTTVMYI